MREILFAALSFAALGGVIGLLLAIASKAFAVPVNEKAEKISELLPGANCGGCGYSGCGACAEAIAEGKAKVNACTVGGEEVANAVAEVLGVKAEKTVRLRAQVMCSGTTELAKKKYIYDGIPDCVSAMQLGGGSKLCPNGCIGLGSCVSKCPFGAIKVVDGVAFVDYHKCRGCGVCVATCPKHIIKLIPFDSTVWVGCRSVDKGAVTRTYCDVGCISCKICERTCKHDAIHVNDFVAAIDYDKCVGCGECAVKCPRKIIWSPESQSKKPIIKTEELV